MLFQKHIRLIIWLLCTGYCPVTIAQTSVHAIDTVYYNSGSVAQVNFIIDNKAAHAIRYHPFIQAGPLQLITRLPEVVTVQPHDSMVLPVKLYISKKEVAGMAHLVRLTVADDAPKTWANCTTVVYVKPQKEVYITAIQQDVYLHNNDSLTIDIRCNNVGNVGSDVSLNLSDASGQGGAPSITSFFIRGFTDTVLHIRYKVAAALQQLKNSQIKVSGTYNDGSLFSTIIVNVYNTNSRQKYLANNAPLNNSNADMIGLYARYLGSAYKYYELVANGNMPLSGSNDFKYNVNALYYPGATGSNSNLLLMNTSAAYNNSVWGIKAGNIYDNLETPVYGTGGLFQLTIKKGEDLEAGYVNSNYNLAGVYQDVPYKYSNTFFAKYNDALSSMVKLKTQFIQCWDPQEQINYTIGGGSIAIQLPSKQQLVIGGYGSFTTTQPYNAMPGGRYGGAGSLQYIGTIGQWQLLSSNYLTSRQYAGLQKGALNLEEKIVYAPKNKWNSWVRYSKYSNNPEYVSPEYQLQNNNTYFMETAEIGFGNKIGNNITLTVKPYYYHEYTRQPAFLTFTDSFSLRSGRVNTTLNYTGFKQQVISIDGDAGLYQTNFSANNDLCWKVNATYQYKHFTCNTFLQYGPYFTGQLLLYPLTNKPYKIYSFNPGYTGTLFNRATITINDFVSYDYLYNHWENNITVHTAYMLPANFTLEVNYNRLQYGTYTQVNAVDVGIVKRFANSSKVPTAKGRLEISFFQDLNNNGQYDEGEPFASNILVKVNDELFWTDNNGVIIYNGIPKGNYEINIINGNGFYSNVQNIYVNGKTVYKVPMQKMGTLKGKVSLQYQAFSYDIDGNIAGIKIIATDKQGKTFTSVTDEKGDFLFYLPENDYSIQVDIPSLPKKYECADFVKNISVTTAPSAPVSFNIMAQKRQLKIKKFLSASL